MFFRVLNMVGVVFLAGLGVVVVLGLVALWQINPWLVVPAPVLAFLAFRGVRRQMRKDREIDRDLPRL